MTEQIDKNISNLIKRRQRRELIGHEKKVILKHFIKNNENKYKVIKQLQNA